MVITAKKIEKIILVLIFPFGFIQIFFTILISLIKINNDF